MTTGLLLLHAFPMDASMWQPQIDGLGMSMPIIAPNLPGFGGTAPADDVTSMDAMADAAANAVRAAGVDQVILCGLSMGGFGALSFWRRHRELVAGLVFANTRAGADDEAGKGRRADLAERLRAEGSGFLVASPPPLLSANAAATLLDRAKQIIGAQSAEGIAAASLGMAERADSTALLADIDVPVLVITSAGDTLIPPDATEEMATAIPDAQFRMIEGAGHLSNLEAPDQFNIILREFMSSRTEW